MDESADLKELESAVESILFASGEPVHVDRICLALSLERPMAERILRRLKDYYAFERRGIRLLQLEHSWQLCSSPDYADAVRRAFEIRKPAKLSQPALEVLTIFAYYQPTTRAYVDKIRGVDSSYTVSLLLERKLIEPCGRLQVPGRPHLYRTTRQFLRAFHLSSLEDLPPMPELDLEKRLDDPDLMGEAVPLDAADAVGQAEEPAQPPMAAAEPSVPAPDGAETSGEVADLIELTMEEPDEPPEDEPDKPPEDGTEPDELPEDGTEPDRPSNVETGPDAPKPPEPVGTSGDGEPSEETTPPET